MVGTPKKVAAVLQLMLQLLSKRPLKFNSPEGKKAWWSTMVVHSHLDFSDH